jgi:hypothetical protein
MSHHEVPWSLLELSYFSHTAAMQIGYDLYCPADHSSYSLGRRLPMLIFWHGGWPSLLPVLLSKSPGRRIEQLRSQSCSGMAQCARRTPFVESLTGTHSQNGGLWPTRVLRLGRSPPSPSKRAGHARRRRCAAELPGVAAYELRQALGRTIWRLKRRSFGAACRLAFQDERHPISRTACFCALGRHQLRKALAGTKKCISSLPAAPCRASFEPVSLLSMLQR